MLTREALRKNLVLAITTYHSANCISKGSLIYDITEFCPKFFTLVYLLYLPEVGLNNLIHFQISNIPSRKVVFHYCISEY
jgi:hypothetical protein